MSRFATLYSVFFISHSTLFSFNLGFVTVDLTIDYVQNELRATAVVVDDKVVQRNVTVVDFVNNSVVVACCFFFVEVRRLT